MHLPDFVVTGNNLLNGVSVIHHNLSKCNITINGIKVLLFITSNCNVLNDIVIHHNILNDIKVLLFITNLKSHNGNVIQH